MESQNKTPDEAKTENRTGNPSKYVDVLVIGTDLNFAKAVQTAMATLQAANPDTGYRIFPGNQKEKVLELIAKYKLHSVLVEEEFLDTTFETWLKDFRENLKKTSNNAEAPVVLVSTKTDLSRTKSILKAGYMDHIIKPLDQSLFLQKMNMYNKDIKLNDEALLFSMDTKQDVDLGFYFQTKSVSEFGMKVSSNKPVEVGSVVTIFTQFLPEPFAAVVREVSKIDDSNFTVFVLFVGVTPAQTQAIRKFIRSEYAEEKAAG